MIIMNLVSNKTHKRLFITFILALFIATTPLGINASQNQEQDNIIDGIISDEEYKFNITVGGGDFSLFWENVGDEIYFAIHGNTNGWVSIGIDPEIRMENADMIFGWVNGTGTYTIDAFSTGQTGPHPPDIYLGGTDDILEFNGTEARGVTIIEFKRLLNTYDEYDKSIPKSESVTMLWAIGSSDSFTTQHLKRGDFEFLLTGTIDQEEIEIADFYSPLILGSTLVFSLVGLLIFVDSFGRQQQNKKEEDFNRGIK
ncbi:MAG: DOMON domain-containing protein [Candidatus Hodarchaeota archaeon]